MSTGVVSPVSAAMLRPLTLEAGEIQHTFMVPTGLYTNTMQLRDQFVRKKLNPDELLPSDPAELVGSFLGYTAHVVESEPGPFDDVLPIVLNEFEARFLMGNDVHTLAASLEVEDPEAIVSAYLDARRIAHRPIRAHASALLREVEDDNAHLSAIFGGQGNSDEYFKELQQLYKTYQGLLTPFLTSASKLLRTLALEHQDASKVYTEGLDVLAWVKDEATCPKNDYLLSASVSVPVIGVIQFCHYIVTCRVLGLTPGQFREHLTSTTGHSQGIVTAVAVATANTWEDFSGLAARALTCLFFIGLRSQVAFPYTSLLPTVLQDSLDNNEGSPSPMLAIKDLTIEKLQGYIDQTNKYLPSDKHIQVSLINGPRSFVLSGPPMSLYGLNRSIRADKAGDESVGRTPFSQRKLRITTRFLPITAPFHSFLLQHATDKIIDDITKCGAGFNAADLAIPVYDTFDGSDLRDSSNLTARLIKLITELPVNWEKATAFKGITHLIDFGPGGAAGLGQLTHRNKEGTGVRVIVAGVLGGRGLSDELGFKQELFNRSTLSLKYAPDWKESFSPKLVRTSKGKVFVDTKFSRLLGRAPIMVPGMTPSTVSPEVVAATMNAGYHIELAGGGYFLEDTLVKALEQVQKLTSPAMGISLNVLYVNPFMLQWCIPMVEKLRKQGFPLEGLTIGAGVPSVEVANDYIRNLGLKHISFKPGTVESILQCAQIAAANPDFPVIVQWTGGRGGGHHSFEDFHQPILATYGQLRKQPNLILIAGSGFGDAESSYPYLTGEWSTKFQYPPMPFDGLLMGSRCMVAKEFHTSPAAKRAIVDAPGVEDCHWEGTYTKPTGGIITVMSEMGEPIHKLATRGVMLWKDLDTKIFAVPRGPKRVAALLAMKDTLIKRLNDDFQKPWFGRKSDGSVADLDEMTYGEVVERLVELQFVRTERRWIDVSLRNMTAQFVRRVEERLTQQQQRLSVLQSFSQLDDPDSFLGLFFAEYPEARQQIIQAQDKDYFLMLCLDKFKKPVPFIPVLDDNFEFYFKKDSLWQSEDLAAVVDQDVGRTCILQGPVAARYSKVVDEPIGKILDDIHEGHINHLIKDHYEGDKSSIPTIECFGGPAPSEDAGFEFDYPHATISKHGNTQIYSIDHDCTDLPPLEEWLAALAGSHYGWRYALLSSHRIVQGNKHVANRLRDVFGPAPGLTVKFENFDNMEKLKISVFERARGQEHLVAFAKWAGDGIIDVSLREWRTADGKPADLPLKYRYDPAVGYAPISEITEGRNDRIKKFYWTVWFGADSKYETIDDLKSPWNEEPVMVDPAAVQDFVNAVGNKGEAYVSLPNRKVFAPMDFAIVLGWKAIIKAIFPAVIDGDLLRLVHLSNGFKVIQGEAPLAERDIVSTSTRITSVTNSASGKTIEVMGTLVRGGRPVMEVTSQFLYRGDFKDYPATFRVQDEIPMELTLATARDVAILRSKEWFHPREETADFNLLGKTLIARCKSTVHYKDAKSFSSVLTTGHLLHELPTKEIVYVADIVYEAGESYGNPVVDYMQRMGQPIEQPVPFDKPIPLTAEPLELRAPVSNELYGAVSGDYNPIHVSRVFASYAGLPGTITHGMFSSASVRALVEVWAADNVIQRCRAFSCQFVGMVLPNDILETRLEHVGMINGRKIIKVQTTKRETGEPVLIGEAEVDQPTTAYVFTGQGSQEQNMGMDLYNSSPVAREVWDRADRHFVETYGISILKIVRENPRELTVHFGGEQGKRIRENYIAMTFETIDSETGDLKREPIFKSIDQESSHYTFLSPNGLLAMTQFTQPALTLMEKASFEDMRSKGLVDSNSIFAGHSLGEYSALASLADVMPVESLVDVVFYRGMTMQVAVPRDELGRSNYGMIAINPSRISPTFSEPALRLVVEETSKTTKWLLEIVNYNVANQQYVAAGDLRALDTLTNVLNVMKIKKINVDKLQEMMSVEVLKEHLAEIVREVSVKSVNKPQPIELERGFATIPLPGISVPFHSSYLLSGVNPFKTFLSKRIAKNAVKPASLVGKYIPNLTAKPFEVSKEYFEEVYKLTNSEQIKDILDRWDDLTRDE